MVIGGCCNGFKSYDEMRKIDVKPFCEKRDGLDYLNWAMCIDLLHKNGAKKHTGSNRK